MLRGVSMPNESKKFLTDFVTRRCIFGSDGLRIIESVATTVVESPLNPIFTKQLYRMLCAYGSVPAAKVVGGTVFIASPADSFRVLRIQRQFRF